MNAIIFDSLSTCQRLRSGGFSEQQAETLAREMKETARDYLHYQLEKLELKPESKIEKMELRVVTKLGGILVAIKYFG